ncbi:hypothetical protein FGO68_gene15445 [Halteria grandinella]|uniref:Deubiquitinating enzyme MINDY-3/4 conserved domain-containing protein n=1 Tax=Halteria grandinella TaxID=5974 RepID=A0A8J8SWL6_HALGN|nr:hypothetical protein FGO68_gene15445 [Halteria grandinella]
MLDILCDFLIIQRDVTGGVDIASSQLSETATTASSTSTLGKAGAAEQPKKVTAIPAKKPVEAKPPPANWFDQSSSISKPSNDDFDDESEASEVIPKQTKKEASKTTTAVVEDDWDIEDDPSSQAGYIKMPQKARGAFQAPPTGVNQQFGNRPSTAVPSSHQQQKPQQQEAWSSGGAGAMKGGFLSSNLQSNPPIAGPKKRVIPKQTKNDDVDELDDLMGFGGGQQEQPPIGKKPAQERDTLGFLKKSEEEKKRKEEEKKSAAMQKGAAYKQLSEVNHNLAGYQANTSYPYTLGQNVPASIRQNLQQQIKVDPISQSESNEIKKLLFKSASSNFHDSWHQGFYFDNSIKYGIYQKEGGPCGILAAVQAYFLKHLLYHTQTKITEVNREQRENLIAAAITDILIQASSETDNASRLTIVIPSSSQPNPKQPIQPHQCQKLTLNFSNSQTVFYAVKDNLSYFIQQEGHGAILLVYSVIQTRGIRNILDDMDMRENSLLTEHGYASQELINIILIGKATSNVFDGDKDMGDNFIIKGIHKQSDIGFLTLFEAYGYFQVGQYLKNPRVPIWIVCSESHYSVLFSTDFTLTQKRPAQFDLIYYDELARQEDDIVLTVKPGLYKGETDLQKAKASDMIPPIDAVIRTKWDLGLVSWNGRQPIL